MHRPNICSNFQANANSLNMFFIVYSAFLLDFGMRDICVKIRDECDVLKTIRRFSLYFVYLRSRALQEFKTILIKYMCNVMFVINITSRLYS